MKQAPHAARNSAEKGAPTVTGDTIEQVVRSGYFDLDFYRAQRGEGIEDVHDAVRDYLDHGWLAGADPSAAFSTRRYLAINADVKGSGRNPLLHYLEDGSAERRTVPPSVLGSDFATRPRAPDATAWSRVELRGGIAAADPAVDVIVPVYKGYDETLRCLHGVVSAVQTTPFRLVVIDDQTPEPELAAALDALSGRGLFELRRTPRNAGFVAACNLGMALHPVRDVVLLNSDTEVHNDWLDRLRAAALRSPDVGSVTPFSNNAEICSYPNLAEDNRQALEIDDAELDRLAAIANAGRSVDLPTGVGFCMYVRRACLDAVGLFDLEAFGRGYGEENDLCRRALKAGWRSVLAADVFVRHHGGTSFGASKRRRIATALETLDRFHPDYLPEVERFLRDDPIRPERARLDVARIRRAAGSGSMLSLSHSLGGGTERHVQELAGLLREAGMPVLFARPADDGGAPALVFFDTVAYPTPNIRIGFEEPPAVLAQLLRELGVRHLHVHNLAGLPAHAIDHVRLAATLAGVRYDVTLHDYTAACPRVTMIDRSGVYCGEPPPEVCESCIATDGSPFGRPVVWDWRARYGRLLGEARAVFVPHADVAERIRRFFPEIECRVRPHPDPHRAERVPALARGPARGDGRRRVALLGGIGPHKGAALLVDVARHALERSMPLDFVVVGYSDRDDVLARLDNVRVTGRYAEPDAARLLAETGADLVWLPSVWPETYSFTLSTAFEAAMFPVVFDLGAPAARIREVGFGAVWPLECMLDPERLATMLVRQCANSPPACLVHRITPPVYNQPLRDYYGLSPRHVLRGNTDR